MNMPLVLVILIWTLLNTNQNGLCQSNDVDNSYKPSISPENQSPPLLADLDTKKEVKVQLSESVPVVANILNGSFLGLPDLTYNVPSFQAPKPEALVKLRVIRKSTCNMKQIPGTSLLSETYYRGMKKVPQDGILTYQDSLIEGGYNLEIDAGSFRNFFYNPVNSWYGCDQWIFKEATDFPGWYELRNKLFPKGLAACSSREVGNGYQVIVQTEGDDLKQFSVGGLKRDRALWKPIGAKDEYFQLKNKNFPNGTITHATRSFFLSQYYVQVDVSPENEPLYELGGKLYDDTLFSVKERKFILNATIQQFQFPEISSELISKHTKTSTRNLSCETTTNSVNETTCAVSHVFQHSLYLAYNFDGNFEGFNQTKVNVELPLAATRSEKSVMEINLTPEGTATEFHAVNSTVKMDVVVPLDESLSFSAYSQWIQDLSTPVVATMRITGTYDDGGLLTADIIRCNLPGAWKNAQINKETEYGIELEVKGQFVGTFGHKRVILTQM